MVVRTRETKLRKFYIFQNVVIQKKDHFKIAPRKYKNGPVFFPLKNTKIKNAEWFGGDFVILGGFLSFLGTILI